MRVISLVALFAILLVVDGQILDGGFETSPSGWYYYSSRNINPRCCGNACGVSSIAQSGNCWIWFGGNNIEETAIAQQTFTIPVGTTALRFYIALIFYPQKDILNTNLQVSLDGELIFFVDAANYDQYALAWNEIDLNISRYADGMTHTLEYEAWNGPTGSNTVNYHLDSVSLFSPITSGVLEHATSAGLTSGSGMSGSTTGSLTGESEELVVEPSSSHDGPGPTDGLKTAIGVVVGIAVVMSVLLAISVYIFMKPEKEDLPRSDVSDAEKQSDLSSDYKMVPPEGQKDPEYTAISARFESSSSMGGGKTEYNAMSSRPVSEVAYGAITAADMQEKSTKSVDESEFLVSDEYGKTNVV